MSTSTKPVLVQRLSRRPAGEIPDALLTTLRDHLTSRHISAGIALFQPVRTLPHIADSLMKIRE